MRRLISTRRIMLFPPLLISLTNPYYAGRTSPSPSYYPFSLFALLLLLLFHILLPNPPASELPTPPNPPSQGPRTRTRHAYAAAWNMRCRRCVSAARSPSCEPSGCRRAGARLRRSRALRPGMAHLMAMRAVTAMQAAPAGRLVATAAGGGGGGSRAGRGVAEPPLRGRLHPRAPQSNKRGPWR